MLVITRKADQSVMIGSDVEVVVLGITKEGVRLGIRAPKSVQVHRREVFEAIAEENRAAASAPRVPVSDAAALLRTQLTPPQGKKPKDR